MTYPKVATFKTRDAFDTYLKKEKIDLSMVEQTEPSALAASTVCSGRAVGNRWAILPMGGWDCNESGEPSELTRRRWLNFAQSGAKLIYGIEAAAVMPTGRNNPRQLLAAEHTEAAMETLCADMHRVHREKFGTDNDLLIGLQLTHAGRHAHPNKFNVRESKNAYNHPLLDQKFGAGTVISDDDVRDVIRNFITAAGVAHRAGFDFIDIKHAHGCLGHEFLTAHDRTGAYGGSFENRTRFFREIATGIRAAYPDIILSARLSIFDTLPYIKGPNGFGIPMEWDTSTPYPYAFGSDETGLDMDPELKEPVAFARMMQDHGVDFICATIGSPYYNVHMQRPAYFPVCDGYLPPQNPLYNVARHLKAVKRLRERCPGMKVVASGLTCLQEFLVPVAEGVIQRDEADFIGIGRMAIAYPNYCIDRLEAKTLDRRRVCRTFGDCTNGPRNGMISGCYPLDPFYKEKPESQRLRSIRKNAAHGNV